MSSSQITEDFNYGSDLGIVETWDTFKRVMEEIKLSPAMRPRFLRPDGC